MSRYLCPSLEAPLALRATVNVADNQPDSALASVLVQSISKANFVTRTGKVAQGPGRTSLARILRQCYLCCTASAMRPLDATPQMGPEEQESLPLPLPLSPKFHVPHASHAISA
ncbi:hypothetical protein ACLKA7_013888 [Drosophila subpalustris]